MNNFFYYNYLKFMINLDNNEIKSQNEINYNMNNFYEGKLNSYNFKKGCDPKITSVYYQAPIYLIFHNGDISGIQFRKYTGDT